MSRSEKHAKALYKALGVFSRTKTIEVFAAINGGICELTGCRAKSRKRVKLLS